MERERDVRGKNISQERIPVCDQRGFEIRLGVAVVGEWRDFGAGGVAVGGGGFFRKDLLSERRVVDGGAHFFVYLLIDDAWEVGEIMKGCMLMQPKEIG